MPEEKYSIDTIFDKYQITGYEMLINIIENYKTHKCNPIQIEDTPEYIDSQKKIKENKKDKIDELTKKINSLTKIIEDNNKKMEEMQIEHEKEIDDLKKELDEKLNNNGVPLPSPSNSNDKKKVAKVVNKDILPKISVFQNPDNNWKERIAKKTFNSINNYHKLSSEINQDPNVNKETFTQIYDYIKKNNCYRSTYWRIKEKIERSFKIYNIYKEKLMYIDFSLSQVSRLNKTKFNLWLQELNKVIDNISENKSS
jgi:hypothetical protein